jgi:hypothetical protein
MSMSKQADNWVDHSRGREVPHDSGEMIGASDRIGIVNVDDNRTRVLSPQAMLTRRSNRATHRRSSILEFMVVASIGIDRSSAVKNHTKQVPSSRRSCSLGIRSEKLRRRTVASAVLERSRCHDILLSAAKAIVKAHELGSSS